MVVLTAVIVFWSRFFRSIASGLKMFAPVIFSSPLPSPVDSFSFNAFFAVTNAYPARPIIRDAISVESDLQGDSAASTRVAPRWPKHFQPWLQHQILEI